MQRVQRINLNLNHYSSLEQSNNQRQNNLSIEVHPISFSKESNVTKVPWNEKVTELILECLGKFKTHQTLNSYFDTLGMKRVVVACPVNGEIQGEDYLNIV